MNWLAENEYFLFFVIVKTTQSVRFMLSCFVKIYLK